MAEFREPKRGNGGGFVSYLYLDGNQVVNSLSAVEGEYSDKITSKSVEEANKGLGITGELGVSGARAEGGASKDRNLSPIYTERFADHQAATYTPLIGNRRDAATTTTSPTEGTDETH
jgi:hypothetical protein